MGTSDLHVMALSNCEFCQIGTMKFMLHLRAYMKFWPVFYIFHLNWDKFDRGNFHKNLLSDCFMKIGTVTPTIYGDKQSSNHTYQMICPVCMKFGVWDLNIILFNISNMKSGARKATLFLWASMKLHLHISHESVQYFDGKKSTGNVRALYHTVHHL